MSEAARILTENAEAVTQVADGVRVVERALNALRRLSNIDPQSLFGMTVREHRELVESLDLLLGELCIDGREIEQVAAEIGFGKEAVEAIRAAHGRLRVLRALAAVASGDDDALEKEHADVRSQVEHALNVRAEASARHWTREEREAFAKGPRPFSPEFEARLNGS